jgi:hypothetical protein
MNLPQDCLDDPRQITAWNTVLNGKLLPQGNSTRVQTAQALQHVRGG